MALQTGVVGDIQTGDIGLDFLGGGIGNHGLSGDDLAQIFNAQAQVQVIQDARERAERQKRMQLLLIITGIVTTIVILLILFYIINKDPNPQQP